MSKSSHSSAAGTISTAAETISGTAGINDIFRFWYVLCNDYNVIFGLTGYFLVSIVRIRIAGERDIDVLLELL